MKFKIIVYLSLLIFINYQIEATKRYSRITGKKCIFCHKSKKGGERNLRKLGKEYKIYLKDKKKLRKKKKTKLNKERILFWKNIIKKNRKLKRKKK
ncbi:MAG: hypothetical protein COB02_11720 [Candidatus Cloacimonadota bacterium]|nr:MAG: hypothetical protein COB02_11720 [Candidatus Cloacimonadota bacterium]